MKAIELGTGQINRILIAIRVINFQFIRCSIGSIAGEKITYLIMCVADKCLPFF